MKIYKGLPESYLNPISNRHIIGLRRDNVSVEQFRAAVTVFICLFLACLMLIACCKPAHAMEYTDNQIVNAIYKAEGGFKAKYPYGIRSVHCGSSSECREICLNTVKKNRIRHKKYVQRRVESYLAYLSRRFSPIGSSNDPKGLNKNWLKNVQYFLKEAA